MGDAVCGSGNRDARILLGRPARLCSRRLPQAGPVGAASVFQPEAPAGGTRWLAALAFRRDADASQSAMPTNSPLQKPAAYPLPKSAAMGRGQGRGQRNGGKPPPKFPHAAKPPEFPSPKKRSDGEGPGRGDKNVVAPLKAEHFSLNLREACQ